jgi:hypothetical protein
MFTVMLCFIHPADEHTTVSSNGSVYIRVLSSGMGNNEMTRRGDSPMTHDSLDLRVRTVAFPHLRHKDTAFTRDQCVRCTVARRRVTRSDKIGVVGFERGLHLFEAYYLIGG